MAITGVTYLRHRITNAASESIDSKIQWVKYTARGFRSQTNFITAIYFHCGGLDLAGMPVEAASELLMPYKRPIVLALHSAPAVSIPPKTNHHRRVFRKHYILAARDEARVD